MNDDQNEPAMAVDGRRRLLKGAFAIPSILTLSSGSALANASSLRCFNALPTTIDPADAGVLGVPRFAVTADNTTSYFVKRQDLQAASTAQGFMIGSAFPQQGTGEFIRIDGTNYAGQSAPVAQTDKFVALRLEYADPYFYLSGLSLDASTSGGTGRVMYASCWTSVK